MSNPQEPTLRKTIAKQIWQQYGDATKANYVAKQILAEFKTAIQSAKPHKEGGESTGRNYWTGKAAGRNQAIDEYESNLNQLLEE